METSAKGIIEAYIEEQQRLETPVARFSASQHEATTPLVDPVYRDLIPLSAPGPGEQYAFEVELDACTGCKACVSACHSLNGLDENESWRDVGLLLGGTTAAPFQQTVTTACHHCADPGCLTGCPVLAYEKDPATGIVRHLDDQCIGCQYCILKCPYDVPKYNERLGIVRKCDMCHQRLTAGEAPACVQACPTHAIRIVTVSVHTSAPARVDTSAFLRAAPDPLTTQPTTRYLSSRPQPANLHAADVAELRPQPPHWPLVVMLTLLPFATVFQCAAIFSGAAGTSEFSRWLPFVLGASALGAASLHLGQPWRAWRVFLGLRTSWFSREAVFLGLWLALTGLALWAPVLTPLAAFLGAASLCCSVMIYADTHRRHWRVTSTAPRFFGTGLVLALAVLSPVAAASVLIAKLILEATALVGGSTSARLLRGPLRRTVVIRFGLGLVGIAGLPGGSPLDVRHLAILAGIFAGELAERYLFFRAVDAPKMPGMAAGAAREDAGP